MDKRITLKNTSYVAFLLDKNEEKLKDIDRIFDVDVLFRGGDVVISGKTDGVERASVFFNDLDKMINEGHYFSKKDFENVLNTISVSKDIRVQSIFATETLPGKAKKITPKTAVQHNCIEAIKKNTITVCIGPAGTGKTYLSVAMALFYLLKKKIKRIILTRPAVEAGEKLGFLPGDMYEKVHPYMKPLYDALYDILDIDRVSRFLEQGRIEIIPLAYMRGRTLNDSFIILDEAQNTSPIQMKMFLTRLGFASKAVITGDITQIDLPSTEKSGLIDVKETLASVEDVEFIYFTKDDIVRNPVVTKIIEAYERKEAKQNKKKDK
ncbi:MAG: PhoH family protein [Deltaproteobacteria bacterium]|nr:PhoH family protein [Deltaproteobacteria bacterium]